MKTALFTLLLLFFGASYAVSRDAEYDMQLSDLSFSATMLRKEYEVTRNEDIYQEYMMVRYQMEGMEIDKGNCPYVAHTRAKQLCNVWWRNVFIPAQLAYEQAETHNR